MGEELPPDWAVTRVEEIVGKGFWPRDTLLEHPVSAAFARYIVLHEEPPVDPIDEALAVVLNSFCPNDMRIYREVGAVKIFRQSLAREGIKLAKDHPHA